MLFKLRLTLTLGTMVMPRSPIQSPWRGMTDDEPTEEPQEVIDAGMLPPG